MSLGDPSSPLFVFLPSIYHPPSSDFTFWCMFDMFACWSIYITVSSISCIPVYCAKIPLPSRWRTLASFDLVSYLNLRFSILIYRSDCIRYCLSWVPTAISTSIPAPPLFSPFPLFSLLRRTRQRRRKKKLDFAAYDLPRPRWRVWSLSPLADILPESFEDLFSRE